MHLVEKPLAPARKSASRNAPREKTAMTLKLGLSAALLMVAAPALAQPPAASVPPPASTQEAGGPFAAIQQAAAAFSQCLSTGTQHVEASVTPEAGVTSVENGCAAQREALDQVVEATL